MPAETLIVGILVKFFYAFALIAWATHPWSHTWHGVSVRSHRVSEWLLFVWLVSRTVIFILREDPLQLITEGLSYQNIFQLSVVVLIAFWAFWLMYSRKITVSSLITGPRIWQTFLALTFIASISWSVWSWFTAYRSVEVAAVWILAVHVFAVRDQKSMLHKLFVATIILSIVNGLLIKGGAGLLFGKLFGALRSNTGGTMAAAYALLLLNQKLMGERIAVWKWPLVGISIVLFGSMSAILSLVVALPFVLLSYLRGTVRLALSFMLVALLLPLIVTLNVGLSDPGHVNSLAKLFGKTDQQLLTLTGRIPLWETIWEATQDKPVGMGYGAADRVFALADFWAARIGWSATFAHNGYVGAWMGAGWLGFVGVITLFLAMAHYGRFLTRKIMPFYYSYLILLAINNMTIAGIGGYMNPAWLVLMALACCPTRNHESIAAQSQSLPASRRGGSGR